MLEARNARHAARGEAEVDVEDELARLTAPAVDPALREEVRELVIARNSRREAKGQPPLDVDAEVERQLREFGGWRRAGLSSTSDSVRSSRLASASGSRLSAITEATIPIVNATNTTTSVITGPTL